MDGGRFILARFQLFPRGYNPGPLDPPGPKVFVGFTVLGENEQAIEQALERLRTRIAAAVLPGAEYIAVLDEIFELHGWSELRERLRALAIDGKREEMQREIPDEVLREFAQTSTYDNLPQFIRQHREYARRMYFVTPIRNEEDRVRFRYLLGELQKLQTPGVPTGMEIG